MMDKMKEEVVEACLVGGVIDMSIQQSINSTFVAINNTMNNTVNEWAAVKARIRSIEDSIASQGSTVIGQPGGGHRGKVLLEYHVINSLQAMSSDKSKYKEWNDKLVNAVVQFRPYARVVLKLMRTFKDKSHDQSEVDMEV